MVVVMVWGKLC